MPDALTSTELERIRDGDLLGPTPETDTYTPSTEIARSEPSMVVIAIGRDVGAEITLDWLLSVLLADPARQLIEASLVIATDPGGRVAKILKNEVVTNDILTMHTAALG